VHYVHLIAGGDVGAFGTFTIGAGHPGISFSTSVPWGNRLGPWKSTVSLTCRKGPAP
jgi:hypothetical protein